MTTSAAPAAAHSKSDVVGNAGVDRIGPCDTLDVTHAADLAGQTWRVETFQREAQGSTVKLTGYQIKDEYGSVVAEQFPQPHRAWVDIRRARLVAAAPALLRSLAALRHHAAFDEEGDLSREEFDALLAAADAALAQVKGGAA